MRLRAEGILLIQKRLEAWKIYRTGTKPDLDTKSHRLPALSSILWEKLQSRKWQRRRRSRAGDKVGVLRDGLEGESLMGWRGSASELRTRAGSASCVKSALGLH